VIAMLARMLVRVRSCVLTKLVRVSGVSIRVLVKGS